MSQQTLVGLTPGPRCSEAVQFSTLTTKLFFFLFCVAPSPPPAPGHGGDIPLLPLRLGTHQYRLFPVLCSAPSSELLPMHLVSAEHEQQKRNGDCPLHIQTVTFPYTLLWLPLTSSVSSSVLSLFCCLWIGERTTPNLLFLRVVADPLNLRANEIVAGKLYHLIILCPSQVQLTAFLEVRNGVQMKRNMFFIFIFKHHYPPPHPPTPHYSEPSHILRKGRGNH